MQDKLQSNIQHRQLANGKKDMQHEQYRLTLKIASLSRQEPQPTGTTKWLTTLRFGKILGTTSVVRSIQNTQFVF